jgi:hypothetical protein
MFGRSAPWYGTQGLSAEGIILRNCRVRAFLVILASAAMLSACGGRPEGVLEPVALTAAGTNQVDMAVATTRMRSDNRAVLFTGERGQTLDFANIVVSIPPPSARKVGDVQWPKKLPGNPATDFVTVKADDMTLPEAKAWFNSRIKKTPGRQALVFIHGFNNRFDDAVYRYAQIVHDSGAPVVPILFTWPSRGSLLDYGYDRESTNYSRDADRAGQGPQCRRGVDPGAFDGQLGDAGGAAPDGDPQWPRSAQDQECDAGFARRRCRRVPQPDGRYRQQGSADHAVRFAG